MLSIRFWITLTFNLIICGVLALPFIPIQALFFLNWVLSRLYVLVFHRWRAMEGFGVGFYLDKRTSRSTGIMVGVLDGQYSDAHAKCIMDRMQRYLSLPVSLPFRAVPVRKLGYVYWKPVHVDMSYHVRLADGTGDRVFTRDELVDMASRLVTVPYDPTRPLWEFLFVPKVVDDPEDGKVKFGVVVRMQHCIGDGVTTLGVLPKYLSDQAKLHNPIPPAPPMPKWKSALINLAALLTTPSFAMSNVFSRLLLGIKLPSLTGESIYHVSKPLPVDLIKFIKGKCGTRFSEVILASGSSALCHRFQPYRHWLNPIPAGVNVAFPMVGNDEVTNNFGILFMPVANRKMDPVHRVQVTADTVQRLMGSFELLKFSFMVRILGTFYPAWLVKIIFNRVNLAAVMSYIPGPRYFLSLLDSPISFMVIAAPMFDKSGLTITLGTYVDKLRIVVHADKGVVNGRAEVEAIANEFVDHTVHLGKILGYQQNEPMTTIIMDNTENHRL